MKKFGLVVIIIVLTTLLCSACTNEKTEESSSELLNEVDSQSELEQVKEPTAEEEVQEQLENMSLDEKIGQVIITGLDGTEVTEETQALVDSYHVGGFIFFQPNLKTPQQAVQLIDDIKALNQKNDIPLFLSVDQEGGRVTRLPEIDEMKTNEAIGQEYDEDFSYETGKLLATQLHAYGLQVNFAPVVDIDSNPQNPVIGDRSFGNDATIVTENGLKMMQGMQDEGVITSIKHFPGHGDTHEDSHEALPIIEKEKSALEQLELIPFQTAIDTGADMVMVGHILLPELEAGYPATMSKEIVTNLLRHDMGYDGVVITDDMTMGAITNHYELADASVLAIQAGVDIILMAHGNENVATTFDALKTAVETGEITEERLDESVIRILTLKQQYNLEDTPVETINNDELNKAIEKLYKKH